MHNSPSRPTSRNRKSFVPNVLRSLEATLHRDDHLQPVKGIARRDEMGLLLWESIPELAAAPRQILRRRRY